MYIRSWEHADEEEYSAWQHQWVPLDSISPYMAVAVMASEDQRFLKHHGFDLQAIKQAQTEFEEGGRRRGASTISQQTAYFTFLIELMWPKERIMEVYLNSIEMGKGIYGIEAVAQSHFHCHAKELSRSDCALIAATLPNPIRFDSSKPSPYMKRRQLQIKRQMKYIDFLPRKK